VSSGLPPAVNSCTQGIPRPGPPRQGSPRGNYHAFGRCAAWSAWLEGLARTISQSGKNRRRREHDAAGVEPVGGALRDHGISRDCRFHSRSTSIRSHVSVPDRRKPGALGTSTLPTGEGGARSTEARAPVMSARAAGRKRGTSVLRAPGWGTALVEKKQFLWVRLVILCRVKSFARRVPGSRCLWDVWRVLDHAGLSDRSPPRVALTIADRLWTAVVIDVPAAARIYDVTQVELTGRTYRVCRKHCVLIPWPSGAEQGSPEPRWSGSATWLHHRAGDEDW